MSIPAMLLTIMDDTRVGDKPHLAAFEARLMADAADKNDAKAAQEKMRLKKRIAAYRRNLDRVCMARTYAGKMGIPLIDVFAEMDDSKSNPTKRAIKKLRDRLVFEKFGVTKVV